MLITDTSPGTDTFIFPNSLRICIYNGINFWNEFAFVKTLTQSAKAQTLPMAINNFKGEHSANIPVILAVLALSALPMIIMFTILQDKVVKGMTAGSVKG